jgi:hypothetical protein
MAFSTAAVGIDGPKNEALITAMTAIGLSPDLLVSLQENSVPLTHHLFALTRGNAATYWCRRDGWSLEESATLLCGGDPLLVEYPNSSRSPELIAQREPIRRDLECAAAMGNLTFPCPPATLVKWAAAKYQIPVLLAELGTAPTTPAPVVAASDGPAPETKEQRQDRRLKACIDAGLPMNDRAASLRLPDGVGAAADSEGVTRQAFSTDVKAALMRRESAKREGTIVRRA